MGGLINNFRFVADLTSKECHYKAKCYQKVHGQITERRTGCAQAGHESLEYLDRFNVKCHEGEALVAVRFETCAPPGTWTGWANFRYIYQCKQVGLVVTGMDHHKSSCQTARFQNIQFLNRQRPECPQDQAMHGFRFEACNSPRKMRYSVVCGSFESASKDVSILKHIPDQIMYTAIGEWVHGNNPSTQML